MTNRKPKKDQTENLPAVGGTEAKNILNAAQEDAGFEKLIKFRKGDYFIGDELVPLGPNYIAHVIGWTKCWIKFVDGEVADRKVYRVALGEGPPEREDLDELDRDGWPEGLDGKPADPWSLQYLIPLERTWAAESRKPRIAGSSGGAASVQDHRSPKPRCVRHGRRIVALEPRPAPESGNNNEAKPKPSLKLVPELPQSEPLKVDEAAVERIIQGFLTLGKRVA